MGNETQPSNPTKATPRAPRKPRTPAKKVAPKKVAQSLAQAQSRAKQNMDSGAASLEQVHGFLATKKNRGKYFSPTDIAVGLGEGVSDKSVRKVLQRAGLAKGKQAVIEAPGSRDWIALHKAGNKNTYSAFTAGSNLPVAQ